MAHFAAPAGLLVSAEGQRGVEHVIAIDPHSSGAQLGSDAVRFLNVTRPNARGQSINGIVGFGNQIVQIAEREWR